MFVSNVWRLFLSLSLGGTCLLALACSSQVPVSATVGGAQLGQDMAASGKEKVREGAGQEAVALAGGVEEAIPGTAPVVAGSEAAGPAKAIVNKPGSAASTRQENTHGAFLAQALEQEGSGGAGILVSGTGEARSAPDLATLRLGVEAIADTVGQARTIAAASMTEVMASVKREGVADNDVQTGYFSIQPRYTGREVTRCVDPASPEGNTAESDGVEPGTAMTGIPAEPAAKECFQEYRSVITGYEVSNNITVLVRDLATVDDVIDGAVDAGGDNIRFNKLFFSLEDTTDLEMEARRAAVADLETRAGELANLAGVELGALVYLTETGGFQPPTIRPELMVARMALDSGGDPSTPVAPGQVSIEVNVAGQYLIGEGQ